MSSKSESEAILQKKIADLTHELQERESDLARFRNELVKANSQLENLILQIQNELKAAHQIQKILVPTEMPHIPGFEFSSKFIASPIRGGDYFDIFEHDDKFRFGIVIASSSGYSMSALFLSVLLKMTGQLEARRGLNPHQMVEKMSLELLPYVQDKDQAHTFYAVIDRRSYELQYCGAGKMSVLHYSFGQQRLQKMEFSNLPLARQNTQPHLDQTLALQPRDRLIFCTEGVTRTRNTSGDVFGEDRLFKTVLSATKQSVHEMRNEIVYQVEKFAEGMTPEQDQTVIVVEVKDRIIKLAKPT